MKREKSLLTEVSKVKSSSRIIKNLEMIEEKKSCVIPVNHVYTSKKESAPQPEKNEHEEIIKKAKIEAEQIIQQAVEKGKEEAQATIETLKENTYNEAYKQGFKEGETKGFDQGLSEGEKQGDLIRKQAKMVLESAHKSAQATIEKNESEIIQLAMHIAERILFTSLSQNEEHLIRIAQDACTEFKKKKHVIVSVHPEKKVFFEMNIDALQRVCPHTTFSVIEDTKISQDGCVLESDAQVVDTQITGQLEKVKEALLEMRASNEE